MIITTKKEAAQKLGKSFQTPGTVKKEYIARCKGCFPEGEEIICEEPLLSIDKQIGVNVVHPEGRVSVCSHSSSLLLSLSKKISRERKTIYTDDAFLLYKHRSSRNKITLDLIHYSQVKLSSLEFHMIQFQIQA